MLMKLQSLSQQEARAQHPEAHVLRQLRTALEGALCMRAAQLLAHAIELIPEQ